MKKLFLWMLLSFSLLSSPLKAQEVVLGYLYSDSIPKYPYDWLENGYVSQLIYDSFKTCTRTVKLDDDEQQIYYAEYRVYLDTLCSANLFINKIDLMVCDEPEYYECYSYDSNSDIFKYVNNVQSVNISFFSNSYSVKEDSIFNAFLKTLKLPKSIQSIYHTSYSNVMPEFIELETSYLYDLPNLKTVSYKDMMGRYTIRTFALPYKIKSFPEGIKKLEIIDANVKGIQNLPSTLDTLIIRDNRVIGVAYDENIGNDYFYDIHHIDSIPDLPAGLKYLDLSKNNFSKIPPLPVGLNYLDISDNRINELPAISSSLKHLAIGNTYLHTFPILDINDIVMGLDTIANTFSIHQITSLPPLLTYFQMDGLKANQIPFSLPAPLRTLKVNRNPIPVLPTLPSNLLTLELNNNGVITRLPALPSSLRVLKSAGNPVDTLPQLPEYLSCLELTSNKAITILPALPRFLDSLFVGNCTNLKCLPILPRTLRKIENATYIGCIPNYTDYIKSGTLCTNLAKICNSDQYARIGGRVYLDMDGNGIYTTNDRLLDNIIITNDFDSTRIYTASLNGSYQMLLDTAFNNVMKIPNNFIPYTSIVPSNYTINPDKAGFLSDTFSFRFAPKPNIKDLEVQLEEGGFSRPGFRNDVYIFYRNTGSVFISGSQVKVKLLKPTDFNITSCEPMYSSTSGDTLIWDNIGIPQLSQELEKIRLTVEVPASVPLSTPYTYQAFITPIAGDTTPQNNIATVSNIVVGSYDPNDKLVTPEALLPDYPTDTKLTYTIRFQNTGTFLAENVYITDTLTKDIDPASVEVIAASHDYQFFVSGNGILEFKFDNIMLPDSNSNEPASHGFIKFSARPKSGISTGQKIVNKAEIYFDYNEPIITDFAETVIRTTTAVQLSSDIKAVVYPNPANHSLSVRLDRQDLNVKMSIYNLQGAKLFSGAMSDGLIQIDTHDLQSGIYLVVLESKTFSTTLKVMISH